MAFHVPLPMIWLLNYHDRCQMAFKVPINDRYWAFVLCSTKLFFLCLFLLNCHYVWIIWLLVYCFFKSIPLKLPCIVISLLIYLFHILSLIPKFRDPVMSPLPMFHLKYLFCSDKLLLKYPFLWHIAFKIPCRAVSIAFKLPCRVMILLLNYLLA